MVVDPFDLWHQGLPALHQFTDYINSLYPTIKFELVFSEHELHVLDLTLHLVDGSIRTDVYSKPTDSHLLLFIFIVAYFRSFVIFFALYRSFL